MPCRRSLLLCCTRAPLLGALALAGACGHDPTGPHAPRRVGEWDTYGRVRDRWTVAQSGYASACPVVAGDVAVFGTGDGRLIARDRRTGAARWSATVSGLSIDASILVVQDVVVVLAEDRTVGVHRATGAVLWAYVSPIDTVPGPFNYPPLPGYLARNVAAADSAGLAYIPAWGGSVSAVDVRTGRARWVWQFDRNAPYGSGGTGTAVAGDTVYAALYEMLNKSGTERRGWVVGLDRATGRELLRAALPFDPTSVGGRIVVTPGAVVVTSGGGGQLAAVDRTTGAVAWTFNPPPPSSGLSSYASSSGVGGDAETVFQDGGNDRFYAVRAATGERLWENDFFGSSAFTPTASARRVYAADGWSLTVYDRQTGGVVAKVTQPGRGADGLVGCVTVADGEAYATTDGMAWSFWEP